MCTRSVKMWTRENYLTHVQISTDPIHKSTRPKLIQCEKTYNSTNTFYYIFTTKMAQIQIPHPNYGVINTHTLIYISTPKKKKIKKEKYLSSDE